MRFGRFDLLRYGKFTDKSIALPQARRDFHLIVGPNEAGKSTLRSAILDLLFGFPVRTPLDFLHAKADRSEEHTSELQSLMRISYAVFCLQKKNYNQTTYHT